MAKKPFVPASRVGSLHANLGVSQDKKIGMKRLESAKKNGSPLVRKEANEAINMQKGKNRGMSSAGRAAHAEAKRHYGDPAIAKAIGSHAHEQSKAK